VPPAAGPGDNQAVALGKTDGGVQYDVAYALVWVTDGGEVANRNAAYALASCSACTTVAVAFQVVLVVGQSNVVVPQNLAVAGNAQCRDCTTTALALQLVATLRELPSKDVQAQIAAAWSRLDGLDLAAADLGVNEVYAQVRAVQASILGILVSNHLLASDPSRSDTASTPAGTSTSSPSPLASSAGSGPTASSGPTAGPTAPGTTTGTAAEPTPTGSAGPTEGPSPTPSATASSAPSASPSPTP